MADNTHAICSVERYYYHHRPVFVVYLPVWRASDKYTRFRTKDRGGGPVPSLTARASRNPFRHVHNENVSTRAFANSRAYSGTTVCPRRRYRVCYRRACFDGIRSVRRRDDSDETPKRPSAE